MAPAAAVGHDVRRSVSSLAHVAPGLGTSGPQLVVWGFVIPTVRPLPLHVFRQLARAPLRPTTVRHARCQPQQLVISVVVLGEGWHNNHHRFPSAAPGRGSAPWSSTRHGGGCQPWPRSDWRRTSVSRPPGLRASAANVTSVRCRRTSVSEARRRWPRRRARRRLPGPR